MIPNARPRWTGPVAAALPWLLLPLLFSPGAIQISDALTRPGVPTRIVAHYALTFVPWIVFSALVRRRTLVSLQTRAGGERGIGRHLLLWGPICVAHSAVLLVGDLLGVHQYGRIDTPWLARLPGVVLHIAPFDAVLYAAVAAMTAAWGLTRQAHERQRALAEAQLAVLKAQLQPHFLFNVMNAVSELIHADPKAADETLGRLSRLLRKFADQREHTQPLRAELEIVEDYLGIQRALLGGALQFTLSVDRQALGANVPAMLLQPLVENAIVHGARPATITLDVTVEGGTLQIVLDNPVRPGTSGWQEGVGLRNVRQRLDSLYGDAASLVRDGGGPGRVAVRVHLPVRA